MDKWMSVMMALWASLSSGVHAAPQLQLSLGHGRVMAQSIYSSADLQQHVCTQKLLIFAGMLDRALTTASELASEFGFAACAHGCCYQHSH